ncbi:hypothetical protein ACWGIB_21040 [Streptomyces xiamenensis]
MLLTSSALLFGCSGGAPEQNYTVPDNACGISVDQSVFKDLLPPGEEYSEDMDESIEGMHQCTLIVDSEATAYFDIYMLSQLESPRRPDKATTFLKEVDIEGESLVWEKGAGISFRCSADEDNIYAYPRISIRFSHAPIADEEERRDAIEAFARSYVEGVKEYQRCDYV